MIVLPVTARSENEGQVANSSSHRRAVLDRCQELAICVLSLCWTPEGACARCMAALYLVMHCLHMPA
eukprot:6192472-Pleurochrysis_carterae.AAC.1